MIKVKLILLDAQRADSTGERNAYIQDALAELDAIGEIREHDFEVGENSWQSDTLHIDEE